MYQLTQKNHHHYPNVSSCETKELYQYEAKCDDIGEDGDIGGYDAVHEDVEVGEDGDAGGEVGEVDEVGGSDKVRQLL